MVPVKKILVLPDAGPGNPFQYQIISFLEKSGFEVNKELSRRFFATYAAVKKHNPDVIYYDWVQSFILGKTLIITLLKCLSFFLEINYVIHIRKKPILHTLHNMQNHAKRWLFAERIMYSYFLKKCARIRVYSATTRNKIVNTFKVNPEKIHIIQDVPFHFYYPNQVSLEESRLHLQIPMHNYVYLCFGMIKPYKGVEDLIRAFQQIATPNDTLIIAGPSDNPVFVEEMRKLINNHKQIMLYNEFVKNEEVQYYYNCADVAVLPFKNIEHSSSIDLAMSFKKPVITLKTDFMRDLLHHQQFLLFNDVKELGDKMQQVKQVNGNETGQTNYQIADSSNYKDFALFFQNV